MKRNWLMAVCAALLLTLLCLPYAPYVALAEQASDVQEAASVQFDKQIFLLPKVNMDYANKDTERQFEKLLKDLFSLLPQDETVRIVLFPASDNAPELFTKPEELGDALSFPYSVKNTADWLSTIETDYAAQAKQNIVIALESGYARNNIEETWGPLKQLANNGMSVYLFGLETKKNAEAGEALTWWISDGRLKKSDCSNSMTAVADQLHFAWVGDYQNPMKTMLPLLKALTDLTFETVYRDENGTFTLSPYAGITKEMVVLLENRAQDANLNVTNSKTEAVEYEITAVGNALSMLKISNTEDAITVAVDSQTTQILWAPVYGDTEQLELAFGNRDNQTSFNRNQQASFYAAVPALDSASLAQTLENRGAICHLLDAATGEVLQTMQYDAESKVFRADYVFAESSEQRQVCAQLLLNDPLHICLTSEPYTIVVTNSAPEITAQSMPIYLIGNPWEEEKTSLTIPLSYSDHEADAVTLKVVEPVTAMLPGLGSVQLSDDQKSLVISLNDQPQNATPFTISITATDGELTSAPCEISFMLYDITKELQSLQSAGVMELSANKTIPKYERFQATANIVFPEEMPEFLQSKLLQIIQEHYACTLEMRGPNDAVVSIPMQKGEDWGCEANLQYAGVYHIKALFSTEDGTLAIQSPEQEITVTGTTPVRTDAAFPTKFHEMMNQGAKGTEAFWQMEGLVPSALFTDEDGDLITISVTANRVNLKEGETPLKLEAQAAGDEEAELRFTDAGVYEVSIVASDMDGEGETITCLVQVTTVRSMILRYALFGATVALAVTLVVWLIVTLAKPSFKGKQIEVTVRSAHWEKKTVVCADAWNKTAQPVSVLLTCACCPPDGILYEMLGKCTIRPHRQGIILLKAKTNDIGLEKKMIIRGNESVAIKVDHYEVELKVIQN